MALESSPQAAERDTVEELLKRRHLEAEEVRLVVVDGVAYLDGCVASYRQKKALASTAASLPNVREVANRLRVVPGSTRGDRQIKEEVLQALQKDPLLSLYAIDVTVRDGVVELAGRVSSLSGRITAEALAWSVCGVRHVINHLEVAPEKALDSADLALALKQGLQSYLGLPDSTIEVHIERGTAYLKGSVATPDQRLMAEDLIRYHPLINQVVNQLQVREPVQPPAMLSNLPPSA